MRHSSREQKACDRVGAVDVGAAGGDRQQDNL